jgi:glycosyltransferase involved in cell wall biosynthesis
LIIGSHAPQEVLDLADESMGIAIIGYVENLDDYFNNAKVSVAPLRYGAGIKGKIATSASYGVPCVASQIAAEGMGLIDENGILIAGNEREFAQKIIRLYKNKDEWEKISKNSFNYINENYSYSAGK